MDGAASARALIMIAYAFLQSRRLKQAKRGKSNPRPAASATLPAIRTAIVAKLQNGHHRHHVRTATDRSLLKSAKVALATE